MNKEIKYNGYSAQPSDYECQDGELATALNIIPEDGAIHPVIPPAHKFSIGSCPSYISGPPPQILALHKTPTQTNYIILSGDPEETFRLHYLKDSENLIDDYDATEISTDHPLTVFKDIAVIGNTVVVTTSEGINYFLWKDETYRHISGKPPFITLDFGLNRAGQFSGQSSVTIEKDTTSDMPIRSTLTRSQIETIKNHIYGLLLPEATAAQEKGFFWQPFMIRYAFRLFDGSYSWHSSPILMLPIAHPPIVVTNKYWRNLPATLTSDVAFTKFFSLSYRINPFDKDILDKWSDIIKGIDIFVTAPIYTFDQNSDYIRISTTSTEHIGRPAPDLIGNGDYSNFRPSIDLSEDGTDETPSRGDKPEQFYDGYYSDALFDPSVQSEFKKHITTVGSEGWVRQVGERKYVYPYRWDIPANKNFHKNVQDAHTFYKVATIEFDELKPSNEFKAFELPSLNAIETLPTLPDELDSHANFKANTLFAYNNRLMLGALEFSPALPLPMRSLMSYSGKVSDDDGDSIRITVLSRRDGVKCATTSDISKIKNFDSNFPYYIYHSDPGAYKIKIENLTTKKTWCLPLKAHDFLNGAYYCNTEFEFDSSPREDIIVGFDTDANPNPSISLANRAYTSEINNPFYFPTLNRISVGLGTVQAFSTAARALSQGQFGQFPLYAFTTDGIWALQVSDTGTYIARQPITRDVCKNARSITQIDSAVLFVADRGIMLLSGSETTCISDSINADYPFNVLDLPHIEILYSKLGHSDDTCLPLQPFSKFINGCRMIYDYAHQRIIIYNECFSYAYLFSLKEKQWGMTYSEIRSNFNSYPDALALTSDGKLVNFSKSNDTPLPALLVTRPLKLDGANIHKTIDNIIQRGNFRKGHVQSVLYGSRDLVNWHLVWSSKDHYLRGFRGTPYKYFRIALLCNLSSDESIFGASIQFSPRLTNQPR